MLVKTLMSPSAGTVLLDPLPPLYGLQLRVLSYLQDVCVAGCELSNGSQKFTYICIKCRFSVAQ